MPARIASSVCWLKLVARIIARTPAATTCLRSEASATVVRGRYSIDFDRNTLRSSPNSQRRSVSLPILEYLSECGRSWAQAILRRAYQVTLDGVSVQPGSAEICRSAYY